MRRLRALVLPVIAALLTWATVGPAWTSDPRVASTIAAAETMAGDEGAWREALVLLDAQYDQMSEADPERIALAIAAARIASAHGAFERALASLVQALGVAQAVGLSNDVTASILEWKSRILAELRRLPEVSEALDRALQLRLADGAPITGPTLDAASRLLDLALAEYDDQAIERRISQLIQLLHQAKDVPSTSFLHAVSVVTQAMARFGHYDQAHEMADMVEFTARQITAEMAAQIPEEPIPADACHRIDDALRRISGLFVATGDHFRAAWLLTMLDNLPVTCAVHIDETRSLYREGVRARLALEAGMGGGLAAEYGLLSMLASPAMETADPAYEELIRTRLARAHVQLGFIGRSARFHEADRPPVALSASAYEQLERLISRAAHHDLAGHKEEALAVLSAASSLIERSMAKDWIVKAHITYWQIYLLLEQGHLAQATELRRGFERSLEERVRLEGLATEPGSGRSRAPSILASLRLLADVLTAAAEDDTERAQTLQEQFAAVLLPAAPELHHHAQRAYIESCFVANPDSAAACTHRLTSAFLHPANVPYANVEWIPFGAIPQIDGDRFRLEPLRARLFEPTMARLWATSVAAVEALHPTDTGWGTRFISGVAGGNDALYIAQQMIEGGAATAVAQVGQRLAAGSDALADALRQRQEISSRIARHLQTMEAGGSGSIPHELLAALETVDSRIAAEFPDFDASFDTQPLYQFQLNNLLGPDEAFVFIISSTAATYTFALTPDDFGWSRTPLGKAAIEDVIITLRSGLDPKATSRAIEVLGDDLEVLGDDASELAPFDRALAHRLYQSLLEPIAPVIGGRTLYVVKHGPISALPLSVLVTQTPEGADDDPAALRQTSWFVKEYTHVVLPSPSALRLAALRPPRDAGELSFVGFGDPVFAAGAADVVEPAGPDGGGGPSPVERSLLSRLEPLPGTRREINALAEALGDAESAVLRLGRQATEAAVKLEDLSRARIVAFATHGLLAGEAGPESEAGLAFTLPSAPSELDDGFLTVSEAAGLRLDADWLLLSACNTAGGDGRPDSGSLSGLARAFLFAGARSILVSHWPVRDDAAAELTTAAIRWALDNPRAPRAEALRHAMLELIDDRSTPAFAHPSAWAPFILVGEN